MVVIPNDILHRVDNRFEVVCFIHLTPRMPEPLQAETQTPIKHSTWVSSVSGYSELCPTKGSLFKAKQNNFLDHLSIRILWKGAT